MARIAFCIFLLIACCCDDVFAQAARTPFSSFGIGESYGNATASQQGMAGVGVSNPQYLYLNNINPALLVFNGLGGITTFQAGILGEQRVIKDNLNKDQSRGGNLNYLLLGFPIKGGKWVTSVGLMPYSGMNYQFIYKEAFQGSDTVSFRETGTGGLNQVAWSHGVAVNRKISVGARASYLYSTIENSFLNAVQLENQTYQFQPDVHQRYYYRGFAFTGAVSVHLDSLFGKNYKLNFGAVYDLKAKLNTDYLQTLNRTNAVTGTVTTDTLISNAQGRTTIPSVAQVGVSFGKGTQWVFAVDARFTDYSKFGFFENQQASAQKGYRVAAGFELTPNPNSLSSYLKIITYRTGVSFEEYPYLVNGNPLRDFGTNFGLSLPVARGCSVDLSGRWGKRGSIEENTIEEKYFKLYFGVTFNDRWFIKRRFD